MRILLITPENRFLKAFRRGQFNNFAQLTMPYLAGFVRWLAPRYEELRTDLKSQVLEWRQVATQNAAHRRTPEIVANLAVGLRIFLEFAVEADAITENDRKILWERGWSALGQAASDQEQHQLASEPTGLFLVLLRSAIANGTAHLAAPTGGEPANPEAWGWRSRVVGTGEHRRSEWNPLGSRVGWLDESSAYLDPPAAFAVAQTVGRDSGEALMITLHTLKRRLDERGLLASTEAHGGKKRLDVRRTLQGQRREVLHLEIGRLSAPEVPQVPQSTPSGAWGTFVGHFRTRRLTSATRKCPKQRGHRDAERGKWSTWSTWSTFGR